MTAPQQAVTLKNTDPHGGNMDDLTATRLAAEAMGLKTWDEHGSPYHGTLDGLGRRYDPLHDDAQAMALAKRFMLVIDFFAQRVQAPITHKEDLIIYFDEEGETANRAVVYCVAKMWAAKGGEK